MPRIVDFWEKVLFGNPVYFGNPPAIHQKLNALAKLEKHHFERWVEIFSETVDRLFQGETAEKAKAKAAVIAESLSKALQNAFVSIG